MSECSTSNVGDADRDRNVGQAPAVKERSVPNAGDRQAIDRAGNGHHATGTGVFRHGDGAAIIRVIVLRLHRCGWGQQHHQKQTRGAGGP